MGQGGFAVIGGFIALHVGQQQGQVFFVHGHPATLGAVYDGDGLTPVALTGEHPVAQLVVDLFPAYAVFLHPLFHGGDGLLDGHAVQKAGVDHYAGVVLQGEGIFGNIAALDHFNNGQAELGSKIPVALVVAGHAHDYAGAIGYKNVVGYEYRHFFAGGGVYGLYALQPHSGLVLIEIGALQIGFSGRLVDVFLDFVPVFDLVLPLFKILMLRRKNHVGNAEQRVAAGGEHGELVAVGGGKIKLCAGGAAYPVFLLDLDPLNKVQVVQIVDKSLGVLSDAQHPLAFFLADDGRAAALAHALHDLLVCQHAFAGGAPVDGHTGLVGKAVLEHLQKDPLGPFIVHGVGGIHCPVPVKGIAQHLKLACEGGDILLCHLAGMYVGLDGVVFRGQAESVKADGEKHIVALHTALARHDIHGGIRPGMAHMQALSGGIGEFHQRVVLRTGVAGDGGIGLFIHPSFLPLFFYSVKFIIWHISKISFCNRYSAYKRRMRAYARIAPYAPVIRGPEGMRRRPPPSRSTAAQGRRTPAPPR